MDASLSYRKPYLEKKKKDGQRDGQMDDGERKKHKTKLTRTKSL